MVGIMMPKPLWWRLWWAMGTWTLAGLVAIGARLRKVWIRLDDTGGER
jgi:hypothetical protein